MATLGLGGLTPATVFSRTMSTAVPNPYTVTAGRFAVVYLIDSNGASTVRIDTGLGAQDVIDTTNPLNSNDDANRLSNGVLGDEGNTFSLGAGGGIQLELLIFEYNK